jgi:hypothetical protein
MRLRSAETLSVSIQRFTQGEASLQGWGKKKSVRMTMKQFQNAAALRRLLPSEPKVRLAFILSALEVYKLTGAVPQTTKEAGNHVIGLLEEFYREHQDPELVEEGSRLTLKMAGQDLMKHDKWAGMVALTVVPIRRADTLLAVSKILAETMEREGHWPNVTAATHVALALKDVLPPAGKSMIKDAAQRAKMWYEGFMKRPDGHSEAEIIMANLNRITAEF